MQNVLDTFAAEVLRKRKAIGYTQRQLADKLHMSIRTIQDLEHGISNPKAETILLIARELDISIDAVSQYCARAYFKNRYGFLRRKE